MTNNIILQIEYSGKNYNGFQLQSEVPTIQGELELAMYKITGDRIRVMAASRTDAGVHATGQVVSFRTKSSLPPPKFVTGLNHYLPKDISVKRAYRVDSSFNVRRDAVSREYNYYILNSQTRSPMRSDFTYMISEQLDIEAINEACRTIVGKHDFISFTTRNGKEMRNTVRTVHRTGIAADNDLLTFNIVANSFLPHQVRNIVGTLIRVGVGGIRVADFFNIAESKTPGLAGPTAPAHGLCLMAINYLYSFGEN